jgi:alpha/beta superfamily hydrolase
MFAPTAKAPEEQVQFCASHAELRGMLHHPAGRQRGAVVLCTADGEERAWCHRTYMFLARTLAERGFAVLRFEYTGQGESGGAYEDTTIATRAADIAAAVKVATDRTGEHAPALVGARLGAACVLEYTRERPQHPIVLIEPVLDTSSYARNLLRVNLTTQMVIHGQVVQTSEQLLETLAAGGFVSANGYRLSHKFLDGLERHRAAEQLSGFHGRALVVATPVARIPTSSAEIVRTAFPPFWKEPKADMTPPRAVIEAVASWLDRHAERSAL